MAPAVSCLPGWATPVPSVFQLYTQEDEYPFVQTDMIINVPARFTESADDTFIMPLLREKPGRLEFSSLYRSFQFDILAPCKLIGGIELDISQIIKLYGAKNESQTILMRFDSRNETTLYPGDSVNINMRRFAQ